MDEKWKSCSRRIFCGAFCLRRRSFVNLWGPVLPESCTSTLPTKCKLSSAFFFFVFFSNSIQYFKVFFSIFQIFSVFFSNFSISTCCAIRPCQPSASILDGIQRLYHHHCWSIFLNHQIVKGDIWASFWDSLGMWEGCKIWTLYMFTSSFLFTKKWLSSFFGGSPMVQWGSWPSVTSLPLLCSYILHAFSITCTLYYIYVLLRILLKKNTALLSHVCVSVC